MQLKAVMMSSMTQLTVVESVPVDRHAAHPTDFDRTTEVRPADEAGRFDLELSDRWTALVGTHGGYLVALATKVAEAFVPGRSVRTVTTTFLRPGHSGPASAHATSVRNGRTISTVVVDLEQDGRAIASARLTLVAPVAGTEWSTPVTFDMPAPADCSRIQERSSSDHFNRVDGLLDPASLPFSNGDRAMVQGYMRPIDPRPVDAAWLAMASDWFPPPAFVRIEPPLGGISIDLTTHVHHTIDHDQHDWLVARFEIDTSSGGLAVEHGRICTLDGTVLAESFQTRWIAEG